MLFQPLVQCPASPTNVCSAAYSIGNLFDNSCYEGCGLVVASVTTDLSVQSWGQKQTKKFRGVRIQCMDLAKWWIYGGVTAALGISCDGHGDGVGQGPNVIRQQPLISRTLEIYDVTSYVIVMLGGARWKMLSALVSGVHVTANLWAKGWWDEKS